MATEIHPILLTQTGVAPTIGQVLTASSTTAAAWADPTGGISGGVAGEVVWMSAASTPSFTAAGSAGQSLLSGGAATPTWGTPALSTATDGLITATTTVVVSAATAPTSGQVLTASSGTAASWVTPASPGAGTVTSVALSDGSTAPIYTISGSPVTTSGTLTLTLSTETANKVFAGPTTGTAAQPTFRSIVSADIPTLNQSTTGTAALATAIAGGVANDIPYQTAAGVTSFVAAPGANVVLVGNSGAPVWASAPTFSAANLTSFPTLNQSTTGNATTATTSTNLAGGAAGEVAFQTAVGTTGFTAVGTTGQVLSSNGAGTPTWIAAPATGVTSVALSDGSTAPIYTISGSPVTGSGTLTFTLATETANTVFAGPTTGTAAQPTFRAIVAADIPTLNQNTTGTAANVTGTVLVANGGTGDTSFTAYAPILGGTTSTGVLQQSTTGMGTSGYVLTSTGSSSVPTWQVAASASPATYTRTAGTGDNTTVLFTTPTYVMGNSSLLVYNEGVLMTITGDYTETSITSMTFNTAPVTGATLSFIVASSAALGGIAGGAAGEIVFQTGSGATSTTAAGTSGQLLQSAGTGTPTWVSQVRTINAQSGTTYTFVLADGSQAGSWPLVTFGSGSATTVTVPTNSSVAFPVGCQIECSQVGAGKVTFAGAGGVTINSYGTNKSIAGEYVGVTLMQTAANTWLLEGNLIA